MKNRFTVSRTSETGVLWCRFRGQKGNSGLEDKPIILAVHNYAGGGVSFVELEEDPDADVFWVEIDTNAVADVVFAGAK
jgi:hypothetical protein